MPIKQISRASEPGYLIQSCAACGAEHRISLDRGAQKARTGPTALTAGDTLAVQIDGGTPQTVTFVAGDFPDFGRVTAVELAARLQRELPTVVASDDAGGLLLESASTGPASSIRVVGGTARATLGFAVDERPDPCPGRPVLGVSFGPGQHDPNIFALRRCSDCGANECLVRTFEATGPELDGSHFKEHRKAVNSLAEHCKARGWSHPDLVTHHAAETRRVADVHDTLPERWAVVRDAPVAAARRQAVPR